MEYQDVYPGIDVAYYGNQQQLEYDFVVAPGADSKEIQLELTGADGARINARGDLVLHTAAGDLVQQKPFTYQEAGGERHEIASRYVLDGQRVSRDQGPFTASRILPFLPWSACPAITARNTTVP